MSGISWVTDMKKILTGLVWFLWGVAILGLGLALFGCQASVVEPTSIVKAEKFAVPVRIACGARADVISALKDNFEEHRIASGISPKGFLVEVFSAEEGKTFTVLATRPDGYSCVLGYGIDWQLDVLGQVA